MDIMRPGRPGSRARCASPTRSIREFDEGVSRAFGDLGEPGPVYLEIPTDVLRAHVSANLVLDEWMAPKKTRVISPDEATVAQRSMRSGRRSGRSL